MIKLSKMSDHALALCAALAGSRGLTKSAADWALACGLPEATVSKLLKKLCAAGLCKSVRGKAGGYALSEAGEAATALDVVEAVDGALAFADCAPSGRGCEKSTACVVMPHAIKVGQAIRASLRSIAVMDLAGGAHHGQ